MHNERFITCTLHLLLLYCEEINEDEMGEVCSTHVRDGNACKILVRKPKGKSEFGRPMRKWGGNIRMYLKEIGREDADRIYTYK